MITIFKNYDNNNYFSLSFRWVLLFSWFCLIFQIFCWFSRFFLGAVNPAYTTSWVSKVYFAIKLNTRKESQVKKNEMVNTATRYLFDLVPKLKRNKLLKVPLVDRKANSRLITRLWHSIKQAEMPYFHCAPSSQTS